MQITAKQYSRTVALLFLLTLLTSTTKADGLSLWNDGPTKKSIVDFVKRVTTRGSTVVDMKKDWKRVFPFAKS